MSIVNFDRDLRWACIRMGVTHGADHPWPGDYAPVVTPLFEDVGRMHGTHLVGYVLNGTSSVSSGILMVGPDATGGSPYRIKGHAWCDDSETHIMAFMGIASTAPSTTASTPVLYTQVIVSGHRSLDVDEMLNLLPFGTQGGFDLSERDVVFGFAFLNSSAQPRTIRFMHQLSVQRLAVKPPAYESAVR